ncbi:MAG: NUDIX hydrolase [Hyphomicrobiales bacterium]|nr:MAG: NUDIX hydrolase [Hyphomicrobiales bacterium]
MAGAGDSSDSNDIRHFPRHPLLGASIAVWHDGKVLLAERAKPPRAGLWSLPGGLVELGETTAEAALRELREETAVTAEIAGLVDIADIIVRTPTGAVERHYAVACFAGRYTGGEPHAGDDAAAVAWVAPEALNDMALTEGTAALILRSRDLVG